MTVAITDLSVTENYADNMKLEEVQLDDAMTSIQTHSNTKLARNVEQLAKDCFGNANYTFNDNGVASKTNTLFDKQTAYDYYNAGNISIGTAADAGWISVDAVNAAVSITPEIAGKYMVIFTFTHHIESSATSAIEADTSFRITDGTDASMGVNSGFRAAATVAGNSKISIPITIIHFFTWTSTATKTVTLQKYNRTQTNVGANAVSALAANGEIGMIVKKI